MRQVVWGSFFFGYALKNWLLPGSVGFIVAISCFWLWNIRQRLSIEIRIGQYSPNTFLCIVKRKYGFSVCPIGCAHAFLFVFVGIRLFRFHYAFYHVNDYGIKLCGVL